MPERIKDNVPESSYLLPVLLLKTEHDVDGAIDLSPDTENAKSLAYWRKYNGTEESPSSQTTNGNYEITDYSNGLNDAPLVRWIAYMNAAHAYTPDMAHYVWDNFFSKYTRGEDGTLYYEGKAVNTEF